MVRSPSDDLTALFAELAQDATRWDFFAAGRAVEAADTARPRIGESLDPALEAVDFAHHSSFDFPRTTLSGWRSGKRRPAIKSQHLGMTGPMGPLPSHLTEIAIFEQSRRGPTPFGDFLDLLASRSLQQFYRAWANANPAANAQRPADDLFAGFVGAVSGVTGLDFLSPDGRPAPGDASTFDDWRRLPYGGHMAALRSPSAIAAILSDLLDRPVSVTEAVGRWRPVPRDQQSRLGKAHATLGQGTTLGGRFFSVEFDVAFAIRAKSMADLEDMLPGGRAHRLLSEAAGAALPHHIEWRAQVAISEHHVRPARLGEMRLGWTGWTAPRGHVRQRHDLTIRAGVSAPQTLTGEAA